jgi:hypothetical protein
VIGRPFSGRKRGVGRLVFTVLEVGTRQRLCWCCNWLEVGDELEVGWAILGSCFAVGPIAVGENGPVKKENAGLE